jgi:hypothetical protein
MIGKQYRAPLEGVSDESELFLKLVSSRKP